MAMLWVAGDGDFAYPLGSLQRSYRLPPGERIPGHSPRHAPRSPAWRNSAGNSGAARQIDCGGVPLARMTSQGLDGRQASGGFAARAPLVKAQLVSTVDLGPWQKRQWTVADAELDKATALVTAMLPEGDAGVLFHAVRCTRLRGVERACRMRAVGPPGRPA